LLRHTDRLLYFRKLALAAGIGALALIIPDLMAANHQRSCKSDRFHDARSSVNP
jgi:hypothetical protein